MRLTLTPPGSMYSEMRMEQELDVSMLRDSEVTTLCIIQSMMEVLEPVKRSRRPASFVRDKWDFFEP